MVNVEYYYNGAGLDRRDYVRTLDFLEQLASFRTIAQKSGLNVPSIGVSQIDSGFFGTGFEGQHHLMVTFQYRELFEVLDPQIVMLWSIEDTSFLIYPRVVWRIYAGVQLELGIAIPIGNRRSEFGQLPYHVTGIARMWVYY
ncbi:MAG: hypothetical protein KC609_12135 [Myxococcales bacterium]|nr:hypothetical protein [Myxococcales bacterium]